MRPKPTSQLVLAVAVLLLLAGPGPALSSGAPAPLDSSLDHQAGYWNTTFTDTASNSLDLSVFYPAREAGENTTKDVSAAPYPLMVIVNQPEIGPAFRYWRSYGEHLSQRGYTLAILDLAPYDAGDADQYDEMANATLDAIDEIADQADTSGSKLYGMVNTSAVAVAGHGQGAYVALLAAGTDDGGRLHATASMALRTPPGPAPTWGFMGPMEIPVVFLEVSTGTGQHANDALEAKASGYVSLLNIQGGNFSQFMDNSTLENDGDPEATINHTTQLDLVRRYLLAFLDFHLKHDALAASRLYGSQAAADLEDGTLLEWRYGVLDQGVEAIAPAEGARLPTGPLDICATVTNVGPFPMPLRNVTLEVARVLPGPVYQTVFGPLNRSVSAQSVGATGTVSWTPVLTVYGEYVAFFRMNDPDHNLTNNRVQSAFSVVPLMAPTIEHDPPASLELGRPYNLTCRLDAPSGIVDAFINFSDVDGFRSDLPLVEDPVSGDHYVNIPAPTSLGQVSYKIHAKAGNGASNVTNPYYIAVVDTTPPTIEHTQVWTHLPVMSEVELNATVTDAGGIDQVRLLYSDPSAGFRNVSCGRDGDLWFYPVVLGPGSGDMVYSFYALDSWGNEARTGDYIITLVDDEPPVIEPVTPDPVEMGDDLMLEARVTEVSVLTGVWVTYTRPGSAEEVNGTPDVLGDVYRLTVTNLTRAGTLTYAWWARDINGQTSTTGQLEVAIRDTVAPVISDVASGDAVVGSEPWVQARVEDAGGVASVTLEYTDVLGVEGSTAMTEVLPNVYEARIPSQSMGGAVTYVIVAKDPSDNRADTGERTMVVRDIEPPVISHTPPQDLVEGQELTFEAEVTDNVGVAEVWLYLRLSATASYRRLAMDNLEGDVYAYILEEGELAQPNVLYYFEAEDLPPSSNQVREPPGAPSTIFMLNVTERQMRLYGTVRASGGDPIEGAEVSLVGHDDPLTTGEDGAYEFSGLTSGPYILEVRADGFEGVSTNLVLSAETGDRELDVTLVPKRSTDGDGEDLPWTMMAALAIFAVVAILVLVTLRSMSRKG